MEGAYLAVAGLQRMNIHLSHNFLVASQQSCVRVSVSVCVSVCVRLSVCQRGYVCLCAFVHVF